MSEEQKDLNYQEIVEKIASTGPDGLHGLIQGTEKKLKELLIEEETCGNKVKAIQARQLELRGNIHSTKTFLSILKAAAEKWGINQIASPGDVEHKVDANGVVTREFSEKPGGGGAWQTRWDEGKFCTYRDENMTDFCPKPLRSKKAKETHFCKTHQMVVAKIKASQKKGK